MAPESRRRFRRKTGQGLVEYALGVVLVVMVFAVINHNIMKGMGRLWQKLAAEIAAPCPDCTPPEQIEQR